MKTLRTLTLGLLMTILWANGANAADSTGALLQQGLYAEEVEGNLQTAIRAYAKVAADPSASRNHVAQALYRQGMCYLKLKDEASARAALQRLASDFADQPEIVAKALPVLEDLTNFDPAALMPPGTLLYVEFGSPGEQIETIVNMLKGTPFENPLAAIGGKPGGAPNNGKTGKWEAASGKSPANVLAALLNPSMMAEFKKVRSCAIGIIGIAQPHPLMISVLYPGRSDALRGMILAAIGVAGSPGETLQGMQTINLPENMAVAYDDRVIITARPASQLAWCVRQYKGTASEPTLLSNNQSFAKVSKKQRQKNALTLWANVDEAYEQLLPQFPDGQIPHGVLSANALVDFTNINDLVLTASVETNGLAWKADVEFKSGHHCLAYDLIRTPNISPAALEVVPAEAIALASFSLSQPAEATAREIQSQIQNVTGLDLGRELFANVQQVTWFAMPSGGEKNFPGAAGVFAGHSGLALTSRNPAQTRRLLETLLGTANTMSGGQPGAEPGRYRIGVANGRNLYCYMGQIGGTTLLSLNRALLDSAVAAVSRHQSVRASGPLQSAVHQLGPTASKLLLINAGGAIRLLGPQISAGTLNEAQSRQLRESLEQLARASERTTLELLTDEEPNRLAVNATLGGIPPLNEILGPATQISRLVQQGRSEARAVQLRRELPASVAPAASAPVIDGQADACWSAATAYKLQHATFTPPASPADLPASYPPPASPADLAASYQALWDQTNLYLLVDVTDDVLKHDTADWWQSDGVEIYIDGDDAKAPTYGQNDYQFAFNWDEHSPEIRELKHNRTLGVRHAMAKTDTGYRLEVEFPWSALGVKPSAGRRIGLDVEVNDNDGGGRRKSKLAWHDANDRAWQSPQAFGNAELAGLVGWWKFDETTGTTAADSSGCNHSGTFVGNPKWAPGKIGGAITLDGHGSFVRIADKRAFDLSSQATIACWVNLRSVPVQWMAIVTKGDNSWRLSTVEGDKKFHFSVGDWDRPTWVNGSTTVNADEWHHVAAVYDGSVVRLYVDGKLDGTQSWTGGIARNNADVLVGENVERPNRSFDGSLDEVRIYNYALSEREIGALAAAQ